MKELLLFKEVQKLLRLSKSGLLALERTGALVSFRVGRGKRYTQEQIESYIISLM
jgi:hypothetical protein